MIEEKFLEKARELALQASQSIMALHKQPMASSRKEDKSLVTEADFKSDQILREGLLQSFPDHGILTEEDGVSGNQGSGWIWVIDPLDGTKAYTKGIAGFSILVGLLKNGCPHLGIIIDPLENRIYEALRGRGATLAEKGRKSALRVSTRNRFEEMPIATSTGFPEDVKERLTRTLTGSFCPPINSVGIKVGLVVRQEADIYINHHDVHYWDTCAPQVILEEAGGLFTKIDGTPLTYDLSGDHSHHALTVASNGTRHEEVCALYRGR